MDDMKKMEDAISRYAGDAGQAEELGLDTVAHGRYGCGEPTVSGTDPMVTMSAQIQDLLNENAELRRRISEIESMVVPMYAEFRKSPERSRVAPLERNMVKRGSIGPATPISQHKARTPDEYSFAEVSSVASDSSSAFGMQASRMYQSSTNPFAYSGSVAGSGSFLRSNSAIAAQGYVGKTGLWGTAVASMLVSMMRYYIEKKNSSMIMVDEVKVCAVYSHIVDVLYESQMHAGLPKVTNDVSRYLSKSIPRTSKTDVPVSTPDAWLKMSDDTDGKSVLAILRTVITAAKNVPEAMVHPISQLIPYIDSTQLVVERRGSAIYTMYPTAKVSPTPDQWEAWCSILKTNALETYIRYRLSKMTPEATVSKMVSEIPKENLTEKKNWNKVLGYGTYTNFG